MTEHTITVPPEAAGERIDKWLAAVEDVGLSRAALQNLMESGGVLRNGKPASKKDRLSEGDSIVVSCPDPVSLDVVPQNLPLTIVYEDDALLVVNKPQGMVVHPAAGHPDGTLVNALLYHCAGRLSSINGVIRPGIVHRIDKNTSGLLIVAKTDFAHQQLAAQIQAHSFTREYEAVVCGRFREESGTVNAPIGRSAADRQKMCVTTQHAREAVTHYRVLAQFAKHAHVKCRLETGRTHQIRVHMRYIGHPVYGDDVYGAAVNGLLGQCLHAKKIGFRHPVTGAYLEFDSALPPYFTEVLKKVERIHGNGA